MAVATSAAIVIGVASSGCSTGGSVESFMPAQPRLGYSELIQSLAEDGQYSRIPPALRARIRTGGPYPSWMRFKIADDQPAGYLAVGQILLNSVGFYSLKNRRNGPPICQTPYVRNIMGMTVDTAGNLYVTGSNNRTLGVITFSPNCGQPGPTFISTGIPVDPAVDGNTLYVSNLIDEFQAPATILVFAINGGSNPILALSSPFVTKGIAIAVSHHNLFWSNTAQAWSGGQVVEFIGGTVPGIVLDSTKIGADFPGSILFDQADQMLVVDQDVPSIDVYAPPYRSKAFRQIRLMGNTVDCAFGPGYRRLYCVDYQEGSVDVYGYPKGSYLYSFTNGITVGNEPEGIAVQPAVSSEGFSARDNGTGQ